jgi:hypothetical protein
MEHISCRLDYGGVIKTVGRCLPPGKSTLGRGHRSDSSRSLSSYGLLTQLREFPFMRIFYM